MLAQQNLENQTVDLVVCAIQGDRSYYVSALTEPVDAALALFVARRVPCQVVMQDRVEALLEIDTLRQAVCGDQHDWAGFVGEFGDSGDPLGWGQGPGDHSTSGALSQVRCEMFSDVLGRRDVAAEHDRVIALAQKRVDALEQFLEFDVALRALKCLGSTGEGQQLAPFRCLLLVGRKGPWGRVHAFDGFIIGEVENARPAQSVSFVRTGSGGVGGPGSQGRGCGGGAGGQRSEERERGPPSHPLPHSLAVLVEDTAARILEHVIEQVAVGRIEFVRALLRLAVAREGGVLVQVPPDVAAAALNEVPGQERAVLLLVEVDVRQWLIEKFQQVPESCVLAGVRGGGDEQ